MDDEEEIVVGVRSADPDDPTQIRITPQLITRAELEALPEEMRRTIVELPEDQRRAIAGLQRQDALREAVESFPVLGRVATGLINTADAATMGLTAALDDDFGRELRGVAAESFPAATVGGQVAGSLLPLALTGGATAAEMGAANLIPGVLPQAVGNTVERALGRYLLSRGVGQGTSRGLSIAGGMLADGAAAGVQEAITQSNIQGTPLDAEMVMSNALFGAGLGLGMGGLVGLPAGVLSRRAARESAEQANRMIQSGAVQSSVVRDADGRIRLVRGTNPEATNFVTEVANSRFGRLINGYQEVDDVKVRKMAAPGAIQEAVDTSGYTDLVERVALDGQRVLNEGRNDIIGSLRSAEFRQRGFDNIIEDVSDLKTVLRQSAADLESLLPREAIGGRRLGQAGERLSQSDLAAVREVARLVDAAAGRASTGAVARELDNILDRIRTEGLLDKITDVDARARASAAVAQARSGLANLSPEGAAAVRAHEVLEAYDKAVTDLRRRAAVHHNISLDEERINPGVVFASVSDSGFRVKEDLSQDFEKLFTELDQAAVLARDAYGLDTSRLMEGISRNLVDMAEAGRKGELIAIHRDLTSRGSPFMRSALGLLLGFGVGGPAGIAAGLGVTAVANPLGVLTTMSALGASKAAAESRLASGISKLRKSLQRAGRGVRHGARTIPPTVLKLKSEKERREAYQTMIQQLRDLASNPQALIESVGEATTGAAEVSQEMASTMAGSYVRGVQYLVANLPPIDQPTVFGHLEHLEPSRAEMDSFIRRFEAIEDPLSIVEMAAEYTLTADHVEAVRTVYPELYTHIQAEITAMLGDITSLPPYSSRIQVGTLLDVPADPSLDAGFIHRMQQRYAQSSQQQEELPPSNMSVSAQQKLTGNTFSASQSREMRLNGV